LFHTWRQVTPTETGSELLVEAIGLLPATLRVGVLTAGAGFITLEHQNRTRRRLPDGEEFRLIAEEARRASEAVRDALPGDCPTVCIGIDVLAMCRRPSAPQQVGQFAAVIGPGRSEILLVAKGFPTSGEERYLRVPGGDGLATRTFQTQVGTASALVCHDIIAYSPRGAATTAHPWRRAWRDDIQQDVVNANPVIGLHLAHYIETPGSFRQAYSAWATEVTVPLVGVSAVDRGTDLTTARELAAALLTPPG
jgi:hypothetical protein